MSRKAGRSPVKPEPPAVPLVLRPESSISGEHGIGIEKEFVPLLFSEEDLMADLRHAVDPDERSNPGKFFPDSRSCVEVGKRRMREVPL